MVGGGGGLLLVMSQMAWLGVVGVLAVRTPLASTV